MHVVNLLLSCFTSEVNSQIQLYHTTTMVQFLQINTYRYIHKPDTEKGQELLGFAHKFALKIEEEGRRNILNA